MHRADASPDQSTMDLSSSKLCVYRDSILTSEAKLPTPGFGDRTTACDQPLTGSFEKISTLLSDTENETAGPTEVPSWKRALDVTCILLSLPVWLPIVLLITLWIKIASPGPIFFRQERVGRRGRRFMILKFRTMKVNVETRTHESYLEQLINANVPMTKLDSAGDPRIIAGGRILRATGLDELPQLFNVLRGEMSLVGPRPCTPHEFARYQAWQRERVNALPGLTGYWQVNGKNKTTFIEMINMDIFYTKNLSFWLDVEIMVRTLPAIIAQVVETRIAARFRGRAGTGDESSKAAVAEM
jgi:lipopolysaccharide/colanic/teichoic acid biosynthesis glycosyltransferase